MTNALATALETAAVLTLASAVALPAIIGAIRDHRIDVQLEAAGVRQKQATGRDLVFREWEGRIGQARVEPPCRRRSLRRPGG